MKQKNQFTFSVITPAYNSEQYISKCIESVCHMDYDLSKVEHIIVDDGSTDNTSKIVKEYQKKFQHIKYYKKNNGNWGSVINYVKAHKLVHNDYTIIIDSDDFFNKNAFNIVNKFSKNVDLFFGRYKHTDSKKHSFVTYFSYYYLFKRNPYSKSFKRTPYPSRYYPGSFFFKTKYFYKLHELHEKIPYQDTELLIDLLVNCKSSRFSNKLVSYCWRNRAGNTMTNTNRTQVCERLLPALQYANKVGCNETIFINLMWCKGLKEYLKKNSIYFAKPSKICLKTDFCLIRPFLWIIYKILSKKYFK